MAERVLKGNVVVARGRVRVGHHDGLALADVGGNREGQYARRGAGRGHPADAERGAGGGDGEGAGEGVEERGDSAGRDDQVLGEHELDLIAGGVDRRAHQRGPRQVDGGVVGDGGHAAMPVVKEGVSWPSASSRATSSSPAVGSV